MLEDTSLTPQEVADILKITKNTVYELIKRGDLNGYKVGKKIRVDYKDVEEYKNKTKNRRGNETNLQEKSISKSSNTYALSLEDAQVHLNNDFVICGQDILLDILSRYLEVNSQGIHVLRSYSGSYNALLGLYHGKVQIATSHLWDGDSGEYNIPYVRRLVPGIPSVIIHLACRMQGFYVLKNNPKGIKGWEDLKRQDITIVNREKGSGSRILLDEQLRLHQIPSRNIHGYDHEETNHLSVASAISSGAADVGVGIEKAAKIVGIDFIPLITERYDLVILKNSETEQLIRTLKNILSSRQFQSEINSLGDYDTSQTGKIIYETN